MTSILVVLIFVGLTLVILARNFFVQMISFKMTLDATFLLLSYFNQHQQVMLTVAWVTMSVGMIFVFLLMAISLRKLSIKNNLDSFGDEV